MESCHEKSNILDESYQRIRNLVCQTEEPYKGPLYTEKNYHFLFILILIVIIFFFLRSFFYQSGAISLFK
jgi:hypothetical protein